MIILTLSRPPVYLKKIKSKHKRATFIVTTRKVQRHFRSYPEKDPITLYHVHWPQLHNRHGKKKGKKDRHRGPGETTTSDWSMPRLGTLQSQSLTAGTMFACQKTSLTPLPPERSERFSFPFFLWGMRDVSRCTQKHK